MRYYSFVVFCVLLGTAYLVFGMICVLFVTLLFAGWFVDCSLVWLFCLMFTV